MDLTKRPTKVDRPTTSLASSMSSLTTVLSQQDAVAVMESIYGSVRTKWIASMSAATR
jgi:hypothetical protein